MCTPFTDPAKVAAAERQATFDDGGPAFRPFSTSIATVIDRRYRLRQVPEALRYLDEGHAKGELVVIV
jgi:Zinc-binding dehydrogenase